MTLALLILAELLANPPPSPAQSAVTQFEAVSQPQPNDGSTAPDQFAFASDSYERMTVPVRLGEAGPFRFLVDTGSDRTAISRELAARLGLAAAPQAMLHSATGQSHVAMAVIPDARRTDVRGEPW
jgi:hypothetical protein